MQCNEVKRNGGGNENNCSANTQNLPYDLTDVLHHTLRIDEYVLVFKSYGTYTMFLQQIFLSLGIILAALYGIMICPIQLYA